MAAYVPRTSQRTRAKNFTKHEKAILESLWESGELRGVGAYYSPALKRTADMLGRSIEEIKVSELACIIIVNLL